MAGVCVAVLRYDPRRGALIGTPRLTMRGFAAHHVAEEMLTEARDIVRRVLQETRPGSPPATVEQRVQSALVEFFYQRTKNRPEVIALAITD